jgi:hypothetical protein
MSYGTVEEGVVGGENGTSGHAENDLDSLVLEAAKERVGSGEVGGFCHGLSGNKKPSGWRVERTQSRLRALLDEQEYVGGEQQLHSGFQVNRLTRRMSRSSAD